MVPGMDRESVPPGPFTVTVPPAIVTSTPLGTVMGALPMRDIFRPPSPHEAQDLAAHAALARLAVGHEPVAGGQAGAAETAEDPRDLVGLDVLAQARLRDATQPADRAVPVGRVLHADGEHIARALDRGVDLVALDVALALEDGGQRHLL